MVAKRQHRIPGSQFAEWRGASFSPRECDLLQAIESLHETIARLAAELRALKAGA